MDGRELSEPDLALRTDSTRPGLMSGDEPHPVLAQAGAATLHRAAEFFAVTVRNPNTRAAYLRAVRPFLDALQDHGLELSELEPLHMAAYIEHLSTKRSASTVKQHLAAIRRFLGWLVTGGCLKSNAASDVRGPRLRIDTGKTPVLYEDDAKVFLTSIDTSTVLGARDLALFSVMLYGFARVSAAAAMRRQDYQVVGRRAWFVLHEKGGVYNRVPAHHAAAENVEAYLTAADLWDAPVDSPLFRTSDGRGRGLTERGLGRVAALQITKRRAKAAGFDPSTICNHTFRATGVTAYMAAGGDLGVAASIAGHRSTRTTQLYDRSQDRVSLGEIERIRI